MHAKKCISVLHYCYKIGKRLERRSGIVCVCVCVLTSLWTWGVTYIEILPVQTLFRTKAVQWAMGNRIMCTPYKHTQRVKSVLLDLPYFSCHTHTDTHTERHTLFIDTLIRDYSNSVSCLGH